MELTGTIRCGNSNVPERSAGHDFGAGGGVESEVAVGEASEGEGEVDGSDGADGQSE